MARAESSSKAPVQAGLSPGRFGSSDPEPAHFHWSGVTFTADSGIVTPGLYQVNTFGTDFFYTWALALALPCIVLCCTMPMLGLHKDYTWSSGGLDFGSDNGKAKGKAGQGPKPSQRQPTAITIRGTREWREWLERGAEHCLTDVAKLVDVAVSQYLKAQGFDEPRPKR